MFQNKDFRTNDIVIGIKNTVIILEITKIDDEIIKWIALTRHGIRSAKVFSEEVIVTNFKILRNNEIIAF
jgi:hypothetical protein